LIIENCLDVGKLIIVFYLVIGKLVIGIYLVDYYDQLDYNNGNVKKAMKKHSEKEGNTNKALPLEGGGNTNKTLPP
jgi:hypothetical protein